MECSLGDNASPRLTRPGKGSFSEVFRRRFFWDRLLLFAFLLLSLGCSKGEDGATVRPSEPVLRVGTTMNIKQANPVADYYYNILAMVMTHDSLVRFDEALKPVPQLAEKFTSDREGRVWTFDLNSQARWHDGRPVTPEDVKFTFEYLSRHHLSNGWAGHMIDTIETDGHHRVIFRLKAPHSRFLINAGFVVRILPRHIWSNIPDPHKTKDRSVSVGCGPYVLEGFDPAARTVSFRVNRDYYGEHPTMGRVDFKTYGTTDLLALALIKGRWISTISMPPACRSPM
jgi:peptide/nickel transport system substrate-binding protein